MAKVKDHEIDLAVYKNTQGLNKEQSALLREKANSVWFRQYAKKSKENLKKILSKVRKGIKHGKFTYESKDISEIRGFELPKVKKKTGKKKKEEKKVIKPTKQKKKQVKKKPTKKVSRKQKIIERQKKEFAPSGRQYSKTELREGKGSRRAQEYRRKHGIAEGDFSVW